MAFLLFAVGMLVLRARQRHRFVPFSLGIAAVGLILFGKFSLASTDVLYAGLGLLILVSVWNSWPTTSRCIYAPAAEQLSLTRGEQGELTCISHRRVVESGEWDEEK